jgi:hypothetical protein
LKQILENVSENKTGSQYNPEIKKNNSQSFHTHVM